MPDHRKTLARVNISEELSKTAAWKQLTYVENSNSPLSTSPKNDNTDNVKKRRRKRSRDFLRKDKDSTSPKIHRSNNSSNYDDPTDGYESVDNEEEEEEEVSKTRVKRQSTLDKKRSETKDRGIMKRQASHDRMKRQGSQDHDRTTKRQSSQDRKHKKKSIPTQETPLPPWEQPYHSPPRKDFGLLKIPEDDLSFDPACLRSDSPKSESNECSRMPSQSNTPERSLTPEQSVTSTPNITRNCRPNPEHSGEASWEEDDV